MISVTDNFLSQQRVLIISPHPDDECFGCGGMIAKIKSLGGKIFVVVVSVGDSHYLNSREKSEITGSQRIDEFYGAMKYLGVDGYSILYTDKESHERLDSIPRRTLIEKFENRGDLSIQEIKPTIVAIPAISYNQDHEAVFWAAFTACRPGTNGIFHTVPMVISYENTSLNWLPANSQFHAQLYIDITNHLESKIEALSFYKSQMKGGIHHSNLDNIKRSALVRGREVSIEAAECYMIHRWML